MERWTTLAALALCACASPGPETPRAGISFVQPAIFSGGQAAPVLSGYVEEVGSAELSVDGALPRIGADAGQLLESRMRVQSDDGLLHAESRFQVESGDVIDPAAWASGYQPRNPDSFGRQSSLQQLGTRLPFLGAAPLAVQLSQRSETRWLIGADARERDMQQAELSWAPALADFSLSWSRHRGVAPALLECGVQGRVKFASFGADRPQLQLRGRSCDVFSERAPGIESAQGWSAALLWPDGGDETMLRLLALQPRAPADPTLELATAYELGFTRVERFGSWEASGGLAMRRGGAAGRHEALSYWNADARLRRRLDLLDLTASYRTGAAEDWFLPLPASQSEHLVFGVDLSAWLAHNLPASDVGLSFSYDWQRHEWPPGGEREDGVLHARARWAWGDGAH